MTQLRLKVFSCLNQYKRRPDALLTFFRLSEGYYHGDRLSSYSHRLLNLLQPRRTIQCWRSFGWIIGPALMGQAGKETPYIIPFLVQGFCDVRVQYKHHFLMFSSMTTKYDDHIGKRIHMTYFLFSQHSTCQCFSCSGYLLLGSVFLLTSQYELEERKFNVPRFFFCFTMLSLPQTVWCRLI